MAAGGVHQGQRRSGTGAPGPRRRRFSTEDLDSRPVKRGDSYHHVVNQEGPNSKVCPFCAEEIKGAAVLCRFCGSPQPSNGDSSTGSSIPFQPERFGFPLLDDNGRSVPARANDPAVQAALAEARARHDSGQPPEDRAPLAFRGTTYDVRLYNSADGRRVAAGEFLNQTPLAVDLAVDLTLKSSSDVELHHHRIQVGESLPWTPVTWHAAWPMTMEWVPLCQNLWAQPVPLAFWPAVDAVERLAAWEASMPKTTIPLASWRGRKFQTKREQIFYRCHSCGHQGAHGGGTMNFLASQVGAVQSIWRSALEFQRGSAYGSGDQGRRIAANWESDRADELLNRAWRAVACAACGSTDQLVSEP